MQSKIGQCSDNCRQCRIVDSAEFYIQNVFPRSIANLTKDNWGSLAPPPSGLQPAQYIVMFSPRAFYCVKSQNQVPFHSMKSWFDNLPTSPCFCKKAFSCALPQAGQSEEISVKEAINNHEIEFESFMAMFITWISWNSFSAVCRLSFAKFKRLLNSFSFETMSSTSSTTSISLLFRICK